MALFHRTIKLAVIGLAAILVYSGCSDDDSDSNASPNGAMMDEQVLSNLVAGWPDDARMVSQQMIAKYGAPDEATASMLVWHDNGIWKRTIVFRDSVPHEFPAHHTDLLQQFIDFRIDPERFSDVAKYDGSVIAERTKGELSARCDKEEFNILAINLAVDVANGKRSIQEARRFYAENVMAVKAGKKTPYTSEFQFVGPLANTGDPDMPFGD
jgi:hypothetical protein